MRGRVDVRAIVFTLLLCVVRVLFCFVCLRCGCEGVCVAWSSPVGV